jgi:hypothetical protein
MLDTFANPKSFIYHIAKDIVVNGVSIFKDISYCVVSYDQKDWETFGKHLGDAMVNIIIGKTV